MICGAVCFVTAKGLSRLLDSASSQCVHTKFHENLKNNLATLNAPAATKFIPSNILPQEHSETIISTTLQVPFHRLGVIKKFQDEPELQYQLDEDCLLRSRRR